MPSFRTRRIDQSFKTEEPEEGGSQSPRQGQYLSRTVRPKWANPLPAQRPLALLTAQEPMGHVGVVPETASFHRDPPGSRVSKHPPVFESARSPSRVVGTWDGVVTRIGPETFKARVVPVGVRGPEQAVEFSISDVSESDEALFKAGAIFYWTIAYRTTPHRRVRRVSEVRFRRLPSPPARGDDLQWVAEAMQLFDERRETGSTKA